MSLTDVARNGAVTEQTTDDALHYHRRLEDFVAAEEVHRFRVERDGRVTVRDIMTPMVFAVDEETPVQEVAEMMITGRIHRVFVKHRGKARRVLSRRWICSCSFERCEPARASLFEAVPGVVECDRMWGRAFNDGARPSTPYPDITLVEELLRKRTTGDAH